MRPRLRPADVARRGVAFGLLGVVPLVVTALSITGRSDRRDFLAVVSAVGGLFLPVGSATLLGSVACAGVLPAA
ncbi:DUF6336 family protein [Streptomyces viridiviolaceus]